MYHNGAQGLDKSQKPAASITYIYNITQFSPWVHRPKACAGYSIEKLRGGFGLGLDC